ncbi:MAG: hypothetical protein GC191_20825 [Azospirillum sp.]|nr:hypothetical protein [Azospirillum sp.]
MTVRPTVLLVAGSLVVASCAFDDLTERHAGLHPAWLHYLVGDDLRRRCELSPNDRYRVVVNPGRPLPFRSLEVEADIDSGGGAAVMRAITAADLARVDTADPVADWISGGDIFRMSPRDYATLLYWLDAVGAFSPPHPDLPTWHSSTQGFHWLASGCRDGLWFFSVGFKSAPSFVEVGGSAPGASP